MSELFSSSFFGVALSVLTFWIGVKIQKKTRLAICNPLLIAGILLLYINRYGGRHSLRWYILLYAPVRFILECFRYDPERGFLFGLSISQWISLLLVGGVLLLWFVDHRKQAVT